MSVQHHKKLTTTIVPLAPRKEIRECQHTIIIFLILVTVWSALRLYARRVRHAPMNVEDALFYTSVVSFYGMALCIFLFMYLGAVGYHMDQLNKGHVARLTQTVLAIQCLYALAMCTAKWSILWMLKRVFAIRTFWLCTWAIIILQAAWMLMTMLIGVLICRPIQKNWDPTAEGTCGDQIAGYTAVSIVNVIIDVAMCILPLPIIWTLQVKRPYKMALFGIFSIGIVSVVFAVLRLLSLRDLDFDDFSYTVPSVVTWTAAETGVVILVACSPLLRPIFDKLFRRFLSSGRSRNQYNYGSSRNTPQFNSQSHMQPKSKSSTKARSKTRSGFVTVGDSDESLELGDMVREGRIESKATARDRQGSTAGLHEWPSDKDLRMGIMVEKEVSQTVNMVR